MNSITVVFAAFDAGEHARCRNCGDSLVITGDRKRGLCTDRVNCAAKFERWKRMSPTIRPHGKRLRTWLRAQRGPRHQTSEVAQ